MLLTTTAKTRMTINNCDNNNIKTTKRTYSTIQIIENDAN